MNWRTRFAMGVLPAVLSLTFVSRVFADPPPWAGVWRNNKHVNGEPCNRDDSGYRRETDGRPYGGYGGYRAYDPQYGKLMDRMAYDRAKIAEITPTGRHRKALQWYKDDLGNAQRDLYNYRYRGVSYDQPPPSYDPYGSYDANADRSFDWKRDWPLLVGQILTQPR